MGTKPATHYRPTFNVIMQFSQNPIPDIEKIRLERVFSETLIEFPWHTNYQLVHGNSGLKFEKTRESIPLYFQLRQRKNKSYYDICAYALEGSGGTDVHFAIKESQQLSIIRYGEMLNKIVYARYSALRMLEICACFRAASCRVDGRVIEPGDIVTRNHVGKYCFVNSLLPNGQCELIPLGEVSTDSLRIQDRIMTLYTPTEIKVVDHLPQVSDTERYLISMGQPIGERENLLYKWRV